MSKPLVYLVDDNIEFCKLLAVVYEKLGISFEYYTTAKEYYKALTRQEPSASLIDLNFGPEDVGFEIINYVRRNLRSTHPIVVLSGKNDIHSVTYALELGINDYITKPVEKNFLIAKMAQYFQTEEMEDWADSDVDLTEDSDESLLTLPVEITEIDEVGIRFTTPHLVAKGTTVHLKAEALIEIIGKDRSPALTVIATKPLEDEGVFENYAEISSDNEEITRNIRNWISTKTKLAA